MKTGKKEKGKSERIINANDLNYSIKSNGMTIALFLTESDRDQCISYLSELYEDTEFIPEGRK